MSSKVNPGTDQQGVLPLGKWVRVLSLISVMSGSKSGRVVTYDRDFLTPIDDRH